MWQFMAASITSGGAVAVLTILWTAVVWPLLNQIHLKTIFKRHLRRHYRALLAHFDPYLSVTVPEYEGEFMTRGAAFQEVKAYLEASASRAARHLCAESAKDGGKLLLSLSEDEEVADEFADVAVWWQAITAKTSASDGPFSWNRQQQDERRYYRLLFHQRHRELVIGSYLPHVRREGRSLMVKSRQRNLYTNIHSESWHYGMKRSAWSHVPFEHPSTFDTLAMDPVEKKKIMDDLDAFCKGEEFYKRVGKAWKRGYLLYGPPGTGKSAMIAAMANYLDYDVYDIVLTTVRTNTNLRSLFIETKGKSIIVIEDIDCSLDLTGKRKKKKPKKEDADKNAALPPPPLPPTDEASKVTLSGLLNFVDGLWSAIGSERVIIFTTNHIEKLDPALIRRGRMDRHIHMSYCCFEALKTLAKNYLGEEEYGRVELGRAFEEVRELLQEVRMTPADVAENLMRKGGDADDAEARLEGLVEALKDAKVKQEEAAAAKKAAAEGVDEDKDEDNG